MVRLQLSHPSAVLAALPVFLPHVSSLLELSVLSQPFLCAWNLFFWDRQVVAEVSLQPSAANGEMVEEEVVRGSGENEELNPSELPSNNDARRFDVKCVIFKRIFLFPAFLS
ncbi:hypothetical protein PoB_004599000 [Plakobranchus ocellatus]|uniref:Uncharacterized protein n=1 Tax=Plakobranchus ocellatus TaxID=259542 RepID=A0AAV4BKA9_9GAST|nr:hypothetical protein PoB_004599000 [Plakobranchus ocellatus]